MIIDLSMSLEEGIITFPVHWHPLVEISIMGRLNIEGRETRKVSLGTHTGTHIDAPRHFVANGNTIDCVGLDNCIGPATVLDFRDVEDRSEISLDLLKSRVPSPMPKRVVFNFGWDRRATSLEYYSEHPYLSEECCHWLVQGGVKLVGLDTPMPDDPRNGRGCTKDSPNHKIFLGNDVVLLEYLVNLGEIPTQDFFLVALPLKITGGDGSPVRAVAIVDQEMANER